MSESSRAYPRSKPLGAPARHPSLLAVSSLRSRARTLASSQLRGAAEELLKGALGKLEEHVRGPAGRVRSSERMREVLERDRALAFAAQPASAAVSPAMSPE